MGDPPPLPRASVLVGSVGGGESLMRLLDALDSQVGAPEFEVVVADRCGPAIVDAVAHRHPAVRLLPCPPRTPLPMLRLLALDAARAPLVVVTEDHCDPSPTWLTTLVGAVEGAAAEVVAAGGPLRDALDGELSDRVAFLCEYAAWLPAARGPAGDTDALTGVNTVYRADALRALPRELLSDDLWEAGAHGALLARGGRFRYVPDAVLDHHKPFPLGYYLGQRFHLSRHWAAARFAGKSPLVAIPLRVTRGLASPALPPVLATRLFRAARRSPGEAEVLRRGLPILSAILVVWAAGEAAGCLLGAGDSLGRIE